MCTRPNVFELVYCTFLANVTAVSGCLHPLEILACTMLVDIVVGREERYQGKLAGLECFLLLFLDEVISLQATHQANALICWASSGAKSWCWNSAASAANSLVPVCHSDMRSVLPATSHVF